MRLRKTLKRTAAATLALSMALSAAAPAVTAAYICDVSQGSVNIVVNEDGNKSIQVNGEDVTDDGDGTDDIIITGDNTQAAASQNDTEETASAAEGSENTPSEDGTDQTGSAKETGNDKGSDEPAAPEQPAPTTAPAGDRAAEPPAKPETTVTETKDGTVTEYGAFEADPDVQAEKQVVKAKAAEEPANDPAENEPDDKIMTYEAPAEENTSVVSSVVENVVKIVNNYKDALNIILRNLKVDAGTSKEDAMNISGTGDVTLSVFQSIPLSGIVVVASPQELVGMVVEKAVKMAEKMAVPIVGLVENMSYLVCPDCGRKIYLFGEGRSAEAAKKHGIPLLTQMPIDPQLAALTDEGRIEEFKGDWLADAVTALEAR